MSDYLHKFTIHFWATEAQKWKTKKILGAWIWIPWIQYMLKTNYLWQKAPSLPGTANNNHVHLCKAGNKWIHITKSSKVCLLSLDLYLSRRSHTQRFSQPRNSVAVYSTIIQNQGNHLTASWSNLQRFHSSILSSKTALMVWKYKKMNLAM